MSCRLGISPVRRELIADSSCEVRSVGGGEVDPAPVSIELADGSWSLLKMGPYKQQMVLGVEFCGRMFCHLAGHFRVVVNVSWE